MDAIISSARLPENLPLSSGGVSGKRRFELQGLEGLKDLPPIHKSHAQTTPPEVVERVLALSLQQGVAVEFLHEHLTFTYDDTPMATLLLSVVGAFAAFERALIRERQMEGIALAKQRGVYKGRKRSLDEAAILEVQQRLSSGITKAQAARECGVSRETLYQYLKVA